MGKALYRKYRSKTLGEVIGQEHITTVLNNSIKDKNPSHAYLFTGPRGVGKTSVARILSRDINGLKHDDDNFYPDIIEIDAASNRRIDEIRELREKIVIAPSQLKYKVYIIDEVHMLTKEAFNALLKTLEEPPSHAIFILATTDYHKVPETIVSRCMRLAFRPISVEDTVKHLEDIAQKEKIKIDDAALALIAEHSDGSFRDAISMLDQLSSANKPIDEKLVELMLGIPNKQSLESLLEQASLGKVREVLIYTENLFTEGATPAKLIFELSKLTRGSLQDSTNIVQPDHAVKLLEDLTKAYSYTDQRLGLELSLIKLANANSSSSTVESKTKEEIKTPELKVEEEKIEQPKQAENIIKNDDVWTDVLAKLKNKQSTIYGIARIADATIEDDELNLVFKFAFHHKQMSLDKNKQAIFDSFNDVGASIKSINVILDEEKNKKSTEAKPSNTDDKENVSSLSNIFGSVEVLES